MTDPTPGLFSPLTIRGVTLPNRIGISPMCMYSATEEGIATEWHSVHLGSRAVGGAGMVMLEATAVTEDGRGTPGDLGIWGPQHEEGLSALARLIASQGSVPAIQLFHTGRKGGRSIPWLGHLPLSESGMGRLLAPSPIPFHEDWAAPTEMSAGDVDAVVEAFADGARRAVACGFRVIELHFAHGYLVHQFLSPLANHRTDEFGGPLENRARIARMITRAVRAAIGEETPLFVRLSVVDWVPGGLGLEDSVAVSRWLGEDGADLIDCSSGAVVPGEQVPAAPLYQVPFAETVRRDAGIPTAAVGVIRTAEEADGVIREGRADLVLIGRASLHDPYWPRKAALALGVEADPPVPLPYRRATRPSRRLTQW